VLRLRLMKFRSKRKREIREYGIEQNIFINPIRVIAVFFLVFPL